MLYGRQPKLRMDFRIVSMCKANGAVVSRWHNIARIIGKPGRDGRFSCPPRGDFRLEAARLIGQFNRLDRIPMSRWSNEVFIGRVETVRQNYRQREYPQAIRYSVIRELLRVKGR